ncbi:hypothetical protein DFP72DRAFT_349250 [Ephemerocybe angulata]|uniref:Uncharacterized protein n=1 Tax=Ephemerocybe angulata TaxID=980116 RepID=A0A8H6HVE0_9AGAR|nr:hypothetical protein DFP72DRAFT_454374 [Tulosesus angulatus]KAF6755265.1 hypothetical protein DFP72DRAFT_349250 [Tulosesus angulatus]
MWTVSVLVEAAVFQFAAQLVLVVFLTMDHPGFSLMIGPAIIISGLNCTGIAVRIGMNRAFENTSEESGEGRISSLHWVVGKSTQGASELSMTQTTPEV